MGLEDYALDSLIDELKRRGYVVISKTAWDIIKKPKEYTPWKHTEEWIPSEIDDILHGNLRDTEEMFIP